MSERVLICIGTKKELFVVESGKSRRSFDLRGPFGAGVSVYVSMIDRRRSPRIYASSCDAFFGMKVLQSTDLGNRFRETKSAPAFPEGDGSALQNIWAIEPGSDKKGLLCGVEPASLFHREDGGDSWEMVAGISNHQHAEQRQPGNGESCLHSCNCDRAPAACNITATGRAPTAVQAP